MFRLPAALAEIAALTCAVIVFVASALDAPTDAVATAAPTVSVGH
jgi:hypothetical protein